MSLGLIGEYVGRMFLGMNREPQYVVRQIYSQNEKTVLESDRKPI